MSFKKRTMILMLVLCLILVGCSTAKETADVKPEETAENNERLFTYAINGNPFNIDPTLAYENNGIMVITNAFEGLIEMNDKGEPVPAVAESWTSNEDFSEYVFNIRKDAKWSDGKSVTAHDFVYAWRRAADPATASEFAYFMYYLKNGEAVNYGEKSVEELGVVAVDDHTLKVTLEEPINYIYHIFAFPTYFPVREDVVSENPEKWTLEGSTYISNGPFVMKEWKQNEAIILIKNEQYWGKNQVKLDQVDLQIINDSNTALVAYESGQIDGSYSVPSTEIPRLLVENSEFYLHPSLIIEYIEFNTLAAPFDDIRVRQAFSYAVNRKDITDKITLGGESPAFGLVPYGIQLGGLDFREAGGTYGIKADASNIDEARALLAEAGYPNGEGLPEIVLNIRSGGGNQRLGEALMEMWKQNLGVDNIKLLPQEDKVHYTDLSAGNFQFGTAGWLADYPHPMSFLDMWMTGSGYNNTGYNNETFDELIKKSKVAKNTEETLKYLHDAEDLWMNEHVVAPMYYSSQTVLVKDYVKGFQFTPTTLVYFKNVWLEK